MLETFERTRRLRFFSSLWLNGESPDLMTVCQQTSGCVPSSFDRDECDDSSDLWWFAGVMVVRRIVLSFDELKRVKELAVLTR